MEAAGERGKWDILVEGGVPAALELGVVGDCRFSHCTIDDWDWLGLRIQVKDRINTVNIDNSPNPMARCQHPCVFIPPGIESCLYPPRTITQATPKGATSQTETLH